MQATTKYTHLAGGSVAGRSTAVAKCGRLVGRLALTDSRAAADCPKCLAKIDPAILHYVPNYNATITTAACGAGINTLTGTYTTSPDNTNCPACVAAIGAR